MESNKPFISFVLPTYNEGKSIEKVLVKLDSTLSAYSLGREIVVVDDGSVDDTHLMALRYASKNGYVRVFRCKMNIGKGFATKIGFLKAVGETIVFIDSDLDVDVRQIDSYVQALKKGDIVICFSGTAH